MKLKPSTLLRQVNAIEYTVSALEDSFMQRSGRYKGKIREVNIRQEIQDLRAAIATLLKQQNKR